MSTIYRVIPGDTFEKISRKVYAVETQGERVQRANPGINEPLVPGVEIVIPALPGSPTDQPGEILSSFQDEGALLINGKRFRFWDTIRIVRSLDAISTMEFTAPFDATDQNQRDAFRPFTYQSATFTVGGEELFAGTLMGIIPELGAANKTLGLGGYSLPGVLGDCNRPVDDPIEFLDQTLEDIARSIAGTFGINVIFEAAAGASFPQVSCQQDKKAMVFLAELAKQRGLVIGDNTRGSLVFRKGAGVGVPVARLSQGNSPLVSVSPFHDPQQYYSSVTGIEPVVVGAAGSQFTVRNAKLADAIRPLTFTIPDAVGGDVKPATDAKLGRMFGNMASYSVTVSTWRDELDNLWTPNSTVNLLAPGAMVYNEYSFIIRSVAFERSKAGESATLDLVLPGSFSGQQPEVFPWDD